MFSIKASDRLDYELMCAVFKAGFSRVPVFHDTEDRVVGLIFLKDLVLSKSFWFCALPSPFPHPLCARSPTVTPAVRVDA